eukprot:3248141-Pyramimonas_sp.AAC.2
MTEDEKLAPGRPDFSPRVGSDSPGAEKRPLAADNVEHPTVAILLRRQDLLSNLEQSGEGGGRTQASRASCVEQKETDDED